MPPASDVTRAAQQVFIGRARTDNWRILQVERLLLLAGPPCAGKTTLISRLRNGAVPALSKQLGYDTPSEWAYVDAADLARLSVSSIPRLFLHYDFLAQRSDRGYKYLPEILGHCRSVVILTLWTPPDMLRQRSRSRLKDAASRLITNPRRVAANLRMLSRLCTRHRILSNAVEVERQYDDWFGFSSRYNGALHWVLDAGGRGTPLGESLATVRASAEARNTRARTRHPSPEA